MITVNIYLKRVSLRLKELIHVKSVSVLYYTSFYLLAFFPIAVRAWWTVYKNWRRRGAVRALADQLSVTLEQCQQQCINNSTCIAVTFDGNDPHSNNHCYLNFNRTAQGLSLFGTDLYELTRCGDAASKRILNW